MSISADYGDLFPPVHTSTYTDGYETTVARAHEVVGGVYWRGLPRQVPLERSSAGVRQVGLRNGRSSKHFRREGALRERVGRTTL